MDLVLTRFQYKPDCTLGNITHNDKFICATIEKGWHENKNRISCIPEGTYKVTPYISPTKKPQEVFLLHNVPKRSMIEIHTANWASQLLGCIAVGLRHDILANPSTKKPEPAVVSSVAALKKLRAYAPNGFNLTIKG